MDIKREDFMIRKKIRRLGKFFLGLLSISLLFSGCKFEKTPELSGIEFESDGDLESVQKMSSILVDWGPKVDGDAVLKYFYGQGLEELQDDEEMTVRGGLPSYTRFDCEKDAQSVSVIQNMNGYKSILEYTYNQERAGRRYTNVAAQSWCHEVFSNRIMEIYPKEELESCSTKEALEACAPLAEACGYGDAQVDIYAMTQEAMNTLGVTLTANSDQVYRAPDPDYDYYEAKEKEAELLRQRDEALEAGDEELAAQLTNEAAWIVSGMYDEVIEWTKEKEAYLIVYRNVLNGLLLDSIHHYMVCVYVPYYGQVVYAEAMQPLVVVEVEEEQELISKEEALEETLRILGVSEGDGITITDISLVYAPRYTDIAPENETKTVHPCWRVDYSFSDELLENNRNLWTMDDRTTLIDAIDGTEVTYYTQE